MESTGSDTIFNKLFNPDMIKLDHFDETNFTRWKDKLIFILTELGVAYLLLDTKLPVIPTPTDSNTNEINACHKKCEEDEVRCRGFLLNALSDRLYDLFSTLKMPQKIWKALENEYTSEK